MPLRSPRMLSTSWWKRTWKTLAWTRLKLSKTPFRPSLSKASISPVILKHAIFYFSAFSLWKARKGKENENWKGNYFAGIVTCVPGEGSTKDNPVIHCLDRLKELESISKDRICGDSVDEMAGLFGKVVELCSIEGSGSAAIAVKNGGVELVCSICSKIPMGSKQVLVSALKTLALFLYGMDILIQLFCFLI